MEITRNSIISIIAHDLKDPVTSVSGIAGILLEHWKEFSEEEKTEIICEIRDTSDTTLRLLNDLLEWSKQLAEVSGPCPGKFKANPVVTGILENVRQTANRRNISIFNRISESLSLYADENMFAAVIRNLLTNAVKSCPHGGEVIVSSEPAAGSATLCVSDNGIGMDSIRARTLFSPGQDNHGNGFGLILCRDFVRKNGGQIWAESQEGRGTRVFFTVPV